MTWYHLHNDINHYPGRWWSGGCLHGDRLALILGTRKYLLNIGITWDIEAKDHLFAQVGPNQGLNGEGKGWSPPRVVEEQVKGEYVSFLAVLWYLWWFISWYDSSSSQAQPNGQSRRLWRLLLPRHKQAWHCFGRNSYSCGGLISSSWINSLYFPDIIHNTQPQDPVWVSSAEGLHPNTFTLQWDTVSLTPVSGWEVEVRSDSWHYSVLYIV